MDFHEVLLRGFDDSLLPSGWRHFAHSSDLEITAPHDENQRLGGSFEMVRMFKRLLRGGSKQRVLGSWVL